MKDYQYFNPAYIYQIVGGDKGIVAEMIKTFLDTVPARMQQLTEAVKTNHTNDILFAVHSLKSTFRFMGGNRLAELMEEMESECKSRKEEADVSGLMEEALEVYGKMKGEVEDLLKEGDG